MRLQPYAVLHLVAHEAIDLVVLVARHVDAHLVRFRGRSYRRTRVRVKVKVRVKVRARARARGWRSPPPSLPPCAARGR
eukprot:scaffold74201_cov43-Phaeocystis_antarctica.AAC.2